MYRDTRHRLLICLQGHLSKYSIHCALFLRGKSEEGVRVLSKKH